MSSSVAMNGEDVTKEKKDDSGAEMTKLKKMIHAILISAGPMGLTLKDLADDYRDLCGARLPLSSVGFSTVEALVRSMPDVVHVFDQGNIHILLAVSHKNTEHLEKLITEQRLDARRHRFGGILSKEQLLQRLKTNVVVILLGEGVQRLESLERKYRDAHGDLTITQKIFGVNFKEAMQHKLGDVLQVYESDDGHVMIGLHKRHHLPIDRNTNHHFVPQPLTKTHSTGFINQQQHQQHYHQQHMANTYHFPPVYPPIRFAVDQGALYASPPRPQVPIWPFGNAADPGAILMKRVGALLKLASPREVSGQEVTEALEQMYDVRFDPRTAFNCSWADLFAYYLPLVAFSTQQDGTWTAKSYWNNNFESVVEMNGISSETNGEQRISSADFATQTNDSGFSSLPAPSTREEPKPDSKLLKRVAEEFKEIFRKYPRGICISDIETVYEAHVGGPLPVSNVSSHLFSPKSPFRISPHLCSDGLPVVCSNSSPPLQIPTNIPCSLSKLIYWILLSHPTGLEETKLRKIIKDEFGIEIDDISGLLLDLATHVDVKYLGQGKLLVYLRCYSESPPDEQSACMFPRDI